jgi:hypothetical protein
MVETIGTLVGVGPDLFDCIPWDRPPRAAVGEAIIVDDDERRSHHGPVHGEGNERAEQTECNDGTESSPAGEGSRRAGYDHHTQDCG